MSERKKELYAKCCCCGCPCTKFYHARDEEDKQTKDSKGNLEWLCCECAG